MEFTSENLLLHSQMNQNQMSFHPNSYKYKTTNFQDMGENKIDMSDIFDQE
jgi:hypothetical protein